MQSPTVTKRNLPEALPMPSARSGYFSITGRRIVLALTMLAYAVAVSFALVFVLRSYGLLRAEELSGDAQGGALLRWVVGDTIWNLSHHNSAQALVQQFFLLADIYFGPYPYWSRAFNFIAWATMILSLRTSAPGRRGDAIAIVVILAYFCFKNAASTTTYPWVHVEVSSQILSLSFCLFAADGLVKERPRRILRTWLCAAGCVLFSHAHKGFFFPLAFFLVMGCIVKDKKQSLLLFLSLVLYVVYITYLDGFIYEFYKTAKLSTGPKRFSFAEGLLADALLATGLIGSASKVVSVQLDWFRVAIVVAGLAMAADALRRIVVYRDARFAAAIFLIVPAVGAVVATVAGRFEALGFEIQEGERYWYSSIFFILGMMSYSAQFTSQLPLLLTGAIGGASAVILVVVSFERQDHLIRYTYNMESMHLAMAYDPVADWQQQWFIDHVAEGFKTTRHLLEAKRAEAFGTWELSVVSQLAKPDENINRCAQAEISVDQQTVGPSRAHVLHASLPENPDFDLAVLWSGDRVSSLSYVLQLSPRYLVTIYSREFPPASRLVIYKHESKGGAEPICQVAVSAQ